MESSAAKDIILDFLHRNRFVRRPTPPDPAMRAEVAKAMEQCQLPQVEAGVLEALHTTGCMLAEISYPHISPRCRYYVALYTTCLTYIDDLNRVYAADPQGRALAWDAVAAFGRRFVAREEHPDGILRCLDGLLREAHSYWPPYGALAIVSGALDAVEEMYVEALTGDKGTGMKISFPARKYLLYRRFRAGLALPWAHLNFEKDWRLSEAYLQAIPDIARWSILTNDVLSFYKEELLGETANYVHLRATAEGRSPIDVLRQVSEEMLDTARRVDAIIGEDAEMRAIWEQFMQGYLMFHVATPRFRLGELGI